MTGGGDYRHGPISPLLRCAGPAAAPDRITVLVAVAVTAAWWLPALQARSVLGDALASAVYAGNYRFALRERTIWPRTRFPPRSSTSGRWALRSNFTYFGRCC